MQHLPKENSSGWSVACQPQLEFGNTDSDRSLFSVDLNIKMGLCHNGDMSCIQIYKFSHKISPELTNAIEVDMSHQIRK